MPLFELVKCKTLGLGDRRFIDPEGKSFGAFDPKATVNGSLLPFIGDDLFKFLGRKISASLKDSVVLEELWTIFQEKMKTVDDQLINGPSKAWIYTHLVISHLMWSFTVYDFSENQISRFSDLTTKYLKKWFKLHPSANPSILYLTRQHYGLGLPCIVEQLKAMQIVKHHLVGNSADPITNAVARLVSEKQSSSQSSQWKPSVELKSFEQALLFDSKFGGSLISSKHGLGFDQKEERFYPRFAQRKKGYGYLTV